MKNKIIPAFIAAIFLVSCSKESVNDNGAAPSVTVVAASAVPASTTTAFASEFTGSVNVEWLRESGNRFTVQFNQSNQRHSAGYDDNGHRSSHSVICLSAAVPQLILDAFRQQYPGDMVYEWKLRNDGSWKAHIMRGTVKYEATFSATGVLMKFEKSS
ncbi:MAG TPA: hypothetical protein PLO99_12810 [Chitinophagaceae bacterium]|nr:hypothetical protein [Chitinophagaceae bacterium]